jgi:hypothetical protein
MHVAIAVTLLFAAMPAAAFLSNVIFDYRRNPQWLNAVPAGAYAAITSWLVFSAYWIYVHA